MQRETFEFLLAICQIPLTPPLLKGEFIIPLFVKEGLGEIFKGRNVRISWQHPLRPNPPPPGGRGLIGTYAIIPLYLIFLCEAASKSPIPHPPLGPPFRKNIHKLVLHLQIL